MEIVLRRAIVGYGSVNEVIDLPAKEAHTLIDNGHADKLDDVLDEVEARQSGRLDDDMAELSGDPAPAQKADPNAEGTDTKPRARAARR